MNDDLTLEDVMDECENCDALVEEGTLKATADDVLLCPKCWLVLVEGQKELPLEAA